MKSYLTVQNPWCKCTRLQKDTFKQHCIIPKERWCRNRRWVLLSGESFWLILMRREKLYRIMIVVCMLRARMFSRADRFSVLSSFCLYFNAVCTWPTFPVILWKTCLPCVSDYGFVVPGSSPRTLTGPYMILVCSLRGHALSFWRAPSNNHGCSRRMNGSALNWMCACTQKGRVCILWVRHLASVKTHTRALSDRFHKAAYWCPYINTNGVNSKFIQSAQSEGLFTPK